MESKTQIFINIVLSLCFAFAVIVALDTNKKIEAMTYLMVYIISQQEENEQKTRTNTKNQRIHSETQR